MYCILTEVHLKLYRQLQTPCLFGSVAETNVMRPYTLYYRIALKSASSVSGKKPFMHVALSNQSSKGYFILVH